MLQVYVFIGREHASKVVLERDYLIQIQVGKGLHNPLQQGIGPAANRDSRKGPGARF